MEKDFIWDTFERVTSPKIYPPSCRTLTGYAKPVQDLSLNDKLKIKCKVHTNLNFYL